MVLAAVAGGLLYQYGRSLWHPVLVRVVGGRTVEAVVPDILQRRPELGQVAFTDLVLVADKSARTLTVLNGGAVWRVMPVLAASGGPGPKTRSGDRQVPEGFYPIENLNPDSAYHLSLRVGYPNAEDRDRCRRLGVTDPGGDIYVHGKAVSIGCLALGDEEIERLFVAVARAGLTRTRIVIHPGWELLQHPSGPEADLHRRLGEELRRLGMVPP